MDIEISLANSHSCIPWRNLVAGCGKWMSGGSSRKAWETEWKSRAFRNVEIRGSSWWFGSTVGEIRNNLDRSRSVVFLSESDGEVKAKQPGNVEFYSDCCTWGSPRLVDRWIEIERSSLLLDFTLIKRVRSVIFVEASISGHEISAT